MASPFLGPPCSQVLGSAGFPLVAALSGGVWMWRRSGVVGGKDPYLAPAALPASLPVTVAQSNPSFPPVRMKPEGERLRYTDKHSLY